MFEDLGSFDQAFAQTPNKSGTPAEVKPLRRRKTLKQKLVFWGANLLLMPIVALIYLTAIAEGLREQLSISATRLYKLPVPGAGLLRQYDGWNRLDLAMLMALVLAVVTTAIWCRFFTELMGFGRLKEERSKNPVLFFLLAAITAIIVLGDSGIFFLGLQSKAASSWGVETPAYVPALATVIYMAGLALIGWWHADFKYSDII